jgi:Tfp pilus assembly protein PilO
MKGKTPDIPALLARRRMQLTCLAGFVGATALLYFVGIEPMRAEYDTYEHRLAQVQQQRAESAELQARKRELTESLAEVEQRLEDCPLRLKSFGQINFRVARINQMACDGGLLIEEIELGVARNSDRYRTVPIRVSGRGGFAQLVEVLRALRGRFADTAIVSIEIRGDGGRTQLKPTFEMQLVWYAAPKGLVAAEAGGQ